MCASAHFSRLVSGQRQRPRGVRGGQRALRSHVTPLPASISGPSPDEPVARRFDVGQAASASNNGSVVLAARPRIPGSPRRLHVPQTSGKNLRPAILFFFFFSCSPGLKIKTSRLAMPWRGKNKPGLSPGQRRELISTTWSNIWRNEQRQPPHLWPRLRWPPPSSQE